MPQAGMDRRITCPQCQNQLSITWFSTMIHCSFCQTLIRITRNDHFSKAQRISHSITKNQVAVAAGLSSAEQGGRREKVSRLCGKIQNTTSGTSSPGRITYVSSSDKQSSIHLSPMLGATSPSLMPYWTFSPTPSVMARPKQRAVLCGVTYSKRRKYKLKGTVADVKNMKELLMSRFQFPEDGIRILTEEGKNNSIFPTKKNIQDSLHWLVHDCQCGDSLVFFFSGHGLRQPEFNGDERDGFDETICPVDFMEQGMILDNDINDIIVRPLTAGVTLHAIVDACHSGTILDLSSVYNHSENRWEDNSPLTRDAYKGTSGGLAISFSACRDTEMAADTSAFEGKTMNGAMTYTFTKVINENPDITYSQLLAKIHQEITMANEVYCLNSRRVARIFHKKISQEPMLSSSMEFNANRTKFSFYPVIDISFP